MVKRNKYCYLGLLVISYIVICSKKFANLVKFVNYFAQNSLKNNLCKIATRIWLDPIYDFGIPSTIWCGQLFVEGYKKTIFSKTIPPNRRWVLFYLWYSLIPYAILRWPFLFLKYLGLTTNLVRLTMKSNIVDFEFIQMDRFYIKISKKKKT